MPRPSLADGQQSLEDLAFDAARDFFRSGGYANVEHSEDPDDFAAMCEYALEHAVESAVAAAGFDVDDPDIAVVVGDVVWDACSLDSLATSLAYGGAGREEYEAYDTLYGEKSKRPISTCGQRWRRPVGRARSSRRAAPGRRRGSRRSTTRAGPDDDDGESEPPRRGPGRHLHLDADLLLQGGRS